MFSRYVKMLKEEIKSRILFLLRKKCLHLQTVFNISYQKMSAPMLSAMIAVRADFFIESYRQM